MEPFSQPYPEIFEVSWLNRFAALLDPAKNDRRVKWEPQPGPQTQAVETAADITGYGGQAGGGKTDLLCGLATTRHHRSIIFRREYPQLKDIVDRALEITEGSRLGFNANENIIKLPGSARLEFGAMNLPDDWKKYKGRAKDFFGIDEATEFLETQVRSVIAWNRSTRPGQRCRVVMTFNPPSDEYGEWVVRFFAPWLDETHPNPAAPGELRWYAMLPDADTGDFKETEVGGPDPIEVIGPDGPELAYPQSRTFIRAKLADNVYLDSNPEYRRKLQNTPEPLRSQILYGLFNVGRLADPWQAIPTAWVQAANRRWLEMGEPAHAMTGMGVDVAHGGGDKTVIALKHGEQFARLLSYPGVDTPSGNAVAVLVSRAYFPGARINVDAIGYGASAAERLAERPPQGFGLPAVAVNVASRSEMTDRSGKYRMMNLRAEMYWRLREALDPDHGATLAIPPDAELLSDLCAPRYEITTSGIKIESKLDIKARLKRSPDKGDAVALAMLPVMLPVDSTPAVGGHRYRNPGVL